MSLGTSDEQKVLALSKLGAALCCTRLSCTAIHSKTINHFKKEIPGYRLAIQRTFTLTCRIWKSMLNESFTLVTGEEK